MAEIQPQPTRESRQRRRRRRGIFWPVILIVVGAVFLLDNLGLLANDLAFTILSLWPALFVYWGLSGLFRRNEIWGPFFMLSVFGTLLLINLNMMEYDVLWQMVQLWPILLIVGGIDVMLSRRNLPLALLGVGISLVLLFGSVFGLNRLFPPNPASEEIISQPMLDTASPQIILEPGFASLELDALNDSNQMIVGTIATARGEALEESVDNGQYRLTTDARNPFIRSDNTWALGLNSSAKYDLTIDMGVGDANIDLSALQLSDFSYNTGVGLSVITLPEGDYTARIESGVGQIVINLPARGDITLSIDGGVGSIQLNVPKNANLRTTVDRGIASLQIPNGYTRVDDTFTSPNYSAADDHIEITIDQGVGNIAVREQ